MTSPRRQARAHRRNPHGCLANAGLAGRLAEVGAEAIQAILSKVVRRPLCLETWRLLCKNRRQSLVIFDSDATLVGGMRNRSLGVRSCLMGMRLGMLGPQGEP